MPRPTDPVARAARDRLQGLVAPRKALASRPTSGWTPSAPVVGLARAPDPGRVEPGLVDPGPAGSALTDVPAPDANDVRDVVARMRAGALDKAAARYTASYGHPLEHPSPEAPTGPRRWQLTVRLAVVAAIAMAVLVAGVVARATLTAPAVPVVVVPEAIGSPTADVPLALPGAGVPAPTDVVVHVIGQVASPGVVRLPLGSRVVDAVQAAGGAGPGADLTGLNLARIVADGEQLVVPAPGELVAGAGAGSGASAGGPSTGPARGGADELVDLNAADLAALDELPGIGPVLAQRIVDWRTEHGRFTAVEELGEVAGIGDTLFGRLRGLVRV